MMQNDIKYTLILRLLTAVAWLPLGILYILSDIAYLIIYYLVRYRRDTVRYNLELVFGKENRKHTAAIEKRFYRHLCDCIVETVKLLHISDREIDSRVEVTNGEYIDNIIRSGHSVVLFLGHYGNWEWVQAIIHHFKEPLVGGQVYQPLHDKVMDRVMLRIRSRFGLECIERKHAVRRLINIVNGGELFVIGFISDQRPSPKGPQGRTHFLGQDTTFITGGEKLGNHVNAEFVYLRMEKTSRGHYRLTFCPIVPIPDDNGENPYACGFMKMLEDTIHKAPEYWLWSHKRWPRHKN